MKKSPVSADKLLDKFWQIYTTETLHANPKFFTDSFDGRTSVSDLKEATTVALEILQKKYTGADSKTTENLNLVSEKLPLIVDSTIKQWKKEVQEKYFPINPTNPVYTTLLNNIFTEKTKALRDSNSPQYDQSERSSPSRK